MYSIISYKMSADFNLDTFINEPSLQVVRTLKKSHLQPNHSKGTPVKPKSAGSAADGHKPRQFRDGSGGPICNYCKRRGHVISECWTLEQKRNNPPGDLLVSTVNPPNTRSAPPVKKSHEISSSTNYHPFVSEGYVSLSAGGETVAVKLLRDTGATQSLLVDNVLPLSEQTSVGASVLIQGVGLDVINVPLHQIFLKSELVSGPVIVGIRPTLPVEGISLILGNDLAGGRVQPDPQVIGNPNNASTLRNRLTVAYELAQKKLKGAQTKMKRWYDKNAKQRHFRVRPINAKVEAIVSFPVLTNKNQLMRFLRMVGYYRKFCKNFAVVAEPLTRLLQKKQTFNWMEDQQTAFEKVKRLLTSAPVLAMPDFDQPFIIHVDASDLGLGAVLMQESVEKLEHPIGYFSQKFSGSQRNYSTSEKEALALILSLQHFEFYVVPAKFAIDIYTDHNPLVFLNRVKNNNQRLLRWSLFLQEHNLNIIHIPGRRNVVADSLSRGL